MVFDGESSVLSRPPAIATTAIGIATQMANDGALYCVVDVVVIALCQQRSGLRTVQLPVPLLLRMLL